MTTPASDGNAAARIYEFEVYGTPVTPTRIVLFDGSNMNNFQHSNGTPVTWPLGNGGVEVLGGDIKSKQAFGDFKLHAEFWLPLLPGDVTGQQRANSGIYLQDRYELQVLDSFGDTTPANNECGAIYEKIAPSTNAATAPQTWQTYEVTFRAARFNGSGVKTENARVTVVWNGVTVINNAEINGPTGNGAAENGRARPAAVPGPRRPGREPVLPQHLGGAGQLIRPGRAATAHNLTPARSHHTKPDNGVGFPFAEHAALALPRVDTCCSRSRVRPPQARSRTASRDRVHEQGRRIPPGQIQPS